MAGLSFRDPIPKGGEQAPGKELPPGHRFPPCPQLTSSSCAPTSSLGPGSALLVEPGLRSRSFSRACLVSSNSSWDIEVWSKSHHSNLLPSPTLPSILIKTTEFSHQVIILLFLEPLSYSRAESLFTDGQSKELERGLLEVTWWARTKTWLV